MTLQPSRGFLLERKSLQPNTVGFNQQQQIWVFKMKYSCMHIRGRCKKKKNNNKCQFYVCMVKCQFFFSFFPPTIVFRIFRSPSYLGTMCFSLPFIPNNQLISAQMESTWILTCALFLKNRDFRDIKNYIRERFEKEGEN